MQPRLYRQRPGGHQRLTVAAAVASHRHLVRVEADLGHLVRQGEASVQPRRLGCAGRIGGHWLLLGHHLADLQPRRIAGVKHVDGPVTVQIRGPVVGVDQDRAGGHHGHVRHGPDHLALHDGGGRGPGPARHARWSAPAPRLFAGLQMLRGGISAKTEGLTNRGPVRWSSQTFSDVKTPRLVPALGGGQAAQPLVTALVRLLLLRLLLLVHVIKYSSLGFFILFLSLFYK